MSIFGGMASKVFYSLTHFKKCFPFCEDFFGWVILHQNPFCHGLYVICPPPRAHMFAWTFVPAVAGEVVELLGGGAWWGGEGHFGAHLQVFLCPLPCPALPLLSFSVPTSSPFSFSLLGMDICTFSSPLPFLSFQIVKRWNTLLTGSCCLGAICFREFPAMMHICPLKPPARIDSLSLKLFWQVFPYSF